MNEHPIDPRIDKMMAYLYGELPEAEERVFRRLLEKDDTLRAELEELQSSRDILAGWRVEERVPSFILMEREGRERSNFWERLIAPLRGLAISPAWGLAATAVVLLVLAVAGLRIEPLGNGIAFRFGEPSTLETLAPDGLPLQNVSRSRPPGSTPSAAVAGSEYLTREELQAYNHELMRSLVMLLNNYDARREEDFTGLVRTVYDQVSSQQDYDFEQLHRRVDSLGRELVIDRNRYARSLDDLLMNSPRTEPASLELSPANDTKE
jgi:hypothetical protein